VIEETGKKASQRAGTDGFAAGQRQRQVRTGAAQFGGFMRLLAWAGILAPLLRLGLILLLGALHPDYSQARDFISELGAPDAPHRAVMNLLGIALVGLLLVVFSVPLWRLQPPGPLGTA
jgi:hypothetical protein